MQFSKSSSAAEMQSGKPSRWRCIVVVAVALGLGACSSMPKIPSFGGDAEPQDSTASGQVDRSAAPEVPVSAANREAFKRALAAIKAERWAEAEPLLQKLTADEPKLAAPWVNLGQVYLAKGQVEEARLALKQAASVKSDNCVALNQLGVLSRQVGDFAAAEYHYKRCLAVEPNNETVVLNLGILYELYLGRLPEALAAYRQYQDLSGTTDRQVKGWVMDLERRLGV